MEERQRKKTVVFCSRGGRGELVHVGLHGGDASFLGKTYHGPKWRGGVTCRIFAESGRRPDFFRPTTPKIILWSRPLRQTLGRREIPNRTPLRDRLFLYRCARRLPRSSAPHDERCREILMRVPYGLPDLKTHRSRLLNYSRQCVGWSGRADGSSDTFH